MNRPIGQPSCAAPQHCQTGVSLLEVMIAVLVLAVGVLGAAALQLSALRYNASAAYVTQASFIAYDMLDRIRANADNLGAYTGSVSGSCSQSSVATSITSRDLADLTAAVTCQLPSGSASITATANRATITVAWSEARIVADEPPTEFVVTSLISREPQ